MDLTAVHQRPESLPVFHGGLSVNMTKRAGYPVNFVPLPDYADLDLRHGLLLKVPLCG